MTTRHRILQAGPLMPGLEARLAAAYELHRLDTQPDPETWLAEHGAGIVGMATSAVHGCSAAQIDALPDLQVVSSFGVGLDRIDLDAARRRGIAVGYTPDVLNDCVADLAMALMLDVGRGVSAADRFVRRGEWLERKFPLGRKVSGANLGIVGLGRIGRTIAQRATGFSMPTRYHSRNPVAGVPWGYEPVLRELARWADYLVVITAGGAGTHHLIDGAVLEALGPEGFLVNVSRGSVIDEQALVKALREGRIAGAGLDVFDRERHVPGELMHLDNVVLLPHIASGTQETRLAMADLTFDNLQAFFREGRVQASAC